MLFNSIDFADFKNPGHLNVNGSNKVSAYMAKYLSERGDFPIKDLKYLDSYLSDIKRETLASVQLSIDKSRINIVKKAIDKAINASYKVKK